MRNNSRKKCYHSIW